MVTGSSALTVRRITCAAVGEAVYPEGVGSLTVRRITGAGVGNAAAVVVSSSATVYRIRANGIGVVSATGTMAAVVRRIVGAGLGGTPVIGDGAGVVRRIVGASVGKVSVTGTCAGVVVRITGKGGIYYSEKIKSKPIPAGEKLSDFGEIFDVKGFCEFYDSLSFAVTLIRDYYRGDADFDYNEQQVIINEQSSSLQPTFRQHVGIVPLESFIGNHFQYYVVKSIPTDGRFKWFGADYNIIPRPELDSEFLATEVIAVE